VVIEDGWALYAETEELARGIADDAAEAPLSDDEDFQEWTGEAGDPGIVTLYAAPEAGAFLAESMDSLFGLGVGETSFEAAEPAVVPSAATTTAGDDGLGDELDDELGELPDEMPSPEVPEELRTLLEEFEGMALTVRIDDGALEVEMAGDAELFQQGFPATEAGDDALASLPEDTAAAMGIGFAEGWAGEMLDYFERTSGTDLDTDELLAEAEEQTGLDLPGDLETLLGESTAVAISPDIDPEAFVNSDSPEGLPFGAKIKGDPEEIEAVLDKLRERMGPDADLLVTESDGDMIAVGVDEEYVAKLLEDGDLGDSDTFRNVVREAEDASQVLYVNFDAGDGWLVELAGEDDEAAENLEPLEGVGASVWFDDDAAHMVLRVTTN
jgi:hypothetical protein